MIADMLLPVGYKRVQLFRNDIGHFHACGTLKGRELATLVDTGSASTSIRLDLALEMGLCVAKMPHKAGGFGGIVLDVYEVKDTELRLDQVLLRPRALMAMDFGFINSMMAKMGESLVDAIIGADVLAAQSAVVDYASDSLFQRE